MRNEMEDKSFQSRYGNGITGITGSANASSQQAMQQPADTLQMINHENRVKADALNEGLAALRGRLFGESEVSKDLPSPPNAPIPSIAGSAHMTNESLVNALRQIDSILARL